MCPGVEGLCHRKKKERDGLPCSISTPLGKESADTLGKTCPCGCHVHICAPAAKDCATKGFPTLGREGANQRGKLTIDYAHGVAMLTHASGRETAWKERKKVAFEPKRCLIHGYGWDGKG